MGFQNDITGENGSLIRAQIKSPNYGAGVAGWAIKKDGSAEFNNLTVRGTFVGSEFIVNSSGVFEYSGAPALGNLIGSWTSGSGIDGFGNGYNAGFNLNNGGGSLEITQGGTAQTISMSTGNPSISLAQFMSAFTNGAGNAQYDTLEISGSRNSSNQDNAGIMVSSSSTDLTVAAVLSLFYANPGFAGGFAYYLTLSAKGVQISAGSITAVQPGTGTGSANPAVAETWHNMVLENAGVFSAAGGSFPPPRYRLEAVGGGKVVRLSGAITLLAANTANQGFWQAPAGYQAAYGQHYGVSVKPTAGNSTDNHVNITNTAPYHALLINVGNVGDTFFLDGITYAVD